MHKDADILLNLFVQNDGPPGRQKGGHVTALGIVGIVDIDIHINADIRLDRVDNLTSVVVYDFDSLNDIQIFLDHVLRKARYHGKAQGGVDRNLLAVGVGNDKVVGKGDFVEVHG